MDAWTIRLLVLFGIASVVVVTVAVLVYLGYS